MMKKYLVAILAIVYLAASSEATINFHYCMDKLISLDLSHKKEGRCGSCGMEKAGHKGCCHDEQMQVKIEKDQKASESSFQFLTIFSHTFPATNTGILFVYPSTVLDELIPHDPPRLGALPLFVLNCNFRI